MSDLTLKNVGRMSSQKKSPAKANNNDLIEDFPQIAKQDQETADKSAYKLDLTKLGKKVEFDAA